MTDWHEFCVDFKGRLRDELAWQQVKFFSLFILSIFAPCLARSTRVVFSFLSKIQITGLYKDD
jgi:hypothetical protein